MPSIRNLASLFLTAFLCAGTLAAEPPVARHVFIVSFDQGAPAGIEKADMPVFKSMADEGAHTWEAYTIVPSVTLPAHTSMLTGVGIQKHQIVWNDLIPEKGLVKVPTIFSIAKKSGLVTAMVVAKNKFRTLDLPGSLDAFLLPTDPASASVAAAFAGMVGKLKPNLCFIHFGEPDVAGHAHGMFSPEKMKALADSDAALAVVVKAIKDAGLLDTSVIILTADHGGHDRTAEELAQMAKAGQPPQPGTHGSASPEDVTIPWIAWGADVRKHFTITAPVVQYDTAATALWLLGIPVPESFWGRPVTSAFDKQTGGWP
jgi:arylsulfatase A-like enzyme